MSHMNHDATQTGNVLVVSGELDPQQPYTELWMPDGKVIRLLTTQLAALPVDQPDAPKEATKQSMVVPVIEERIEIGKRTTTTGTINLRKVVQEYQEQLNEPLAVRTFDVERIILNQPVDIAPPVRQEGAITIYSLVEEQMVLTKQLVLKEELRVTQRNTERLDTQVVTLKREHLIVERQAAETLDRSE